MRAAGSLGVPSQRAAGGRGGQAGPGKLHQRSEQAAGSPGRAAHRSWPRGERSGGRRARWGAGPAGGGEREPGGAGRPTDPCLSALLPTLSRLRFPHLLRARVGAEGPERAARAEDAARGKWRPPGPGAGRDGEGREG